MQYISTYVIIDRHRFVMFVRHCHVSHRNLTFKIKQSVRMDECFKIYIHHYYIDLWKKMNY